MPTRAHALTSDVLKLLDNKDLSEQQIKDKLKITQNQWAGLRTELLARWQIATVGRRADKKYTRLNIERTQ